MRNRPTYLTGNHYFSWNDCSKCGPHHLHKHFRCVHCGTEQPMKPIPGPIPGKLAPAARMKLYDALRLKALGVFCES